MEYLAGHCLAIQVVSRPVLVTHQSYPGCNLYYICNTPSVTSELHQPLVRFSSVSRRRSHAFYVSDKCCRQTPSLLVPQGYHVTRDPPHHISSHTVACYSHDTLTTYRYILLSRASYPGQLPTHPLRSHKCHLSLGWGGTGGVVLARRLSLRGVSRMAAFL